MIGRRAVVVRRGPGLVGTMARTAVVAGTATVVAKGVSSSMDNNNQPQQAAPSIQQTQVDSQATDVSAQLEKLSNLKASGSISESEFETAKRKLLSDS